MLSNEKVKETIRRVHWIKKSNYQQKTREVIEKNSLQEPWKKKKKKEAPSDNNVDIIFIFHIFFLLFLFSSVSLQDSPHSNILCLSLSLFCVRFLVKWHAQRWIW